MNSPPHPDVSGMERVLRLGSQTARLPSGTSACLTAAEAHLSCWWDRVLSRIAKNQMTLHPAHEYLATTQTASLEL